jgi:hypothetical protein
MVRLTAEEIVKSSVGSSIVQNKNGGEGRDLCDLSILCTHFSRKIHADEKIDVFTK